MKKITILGAGLAGSLMAVLLRKRGYEVTIIERRSDMRTGGAYAGRSINLAMSTRGWNALEFAGLKKELEGIAIPMFGREIHTLEQEVIFQQYGRNNEAIYSVSRAELNITLMNAAEALGAKIIFDTKCIKVDLNTNEITLEKDGQNSTINCEIILGSDGAFSAIRSAYMQLDRSDYQQFYIAHGYKELSIPAGDNNSFQMKKEALHIWPRKNYMLIALPNQDGSFTCTLFFPFEGNPSFESLKTDEEINSFFKENFPDALDMMPGFLEEYKTNPTASLVTIKTFPWVYKNKSALLGDAAHAIVPFYGQGMNAGFEDCATMATLIDTYKEDWDVIFEKYQDLRKINGDAVAQLALNNFIEMRDKVADPKFLERKKIEKEIGLRFPDQFLSVYEMVSFSTLPYHQALEAQLAQDNLYYKIINYSENFFEHLNSDSYMIKLKEWINEYLVEISNHG
jgi:kynurenine 3-monooxygenase